MLRMNLFILLFIVSICSCKNNGDSGNNPVVPLRQTEKSTNITNSENLTCIDNFKKLRDLIYQKQKSELKSYFAFPIKGNEIWNLVLIDDNSENTISRGDFNEQDFDNYFDKIFTESFVESLLKVKSKELYEKSEFTTPVNIKKFEEYTEESFMISHYDKQAGKLVLTFSSKYIYDNDEDSEETSEISSIFYFRIDKNCDINFEKVVLAG